MSFELDSPKANFSPTHSIASLSPTPDFDDGDDAIPMTTPYTIASAQIVPVHDRADVNLLHANDDEDEAAEQKEKEKVEDRFSIIVETRNQLTALKNRNRSFEPDIDEDNELEDEHDHATNQSPLSDDTDTDTNPHYSDDNSHLKPQTAADIGYVATLSNSQSNTQSDNKFTLGNIGNMAFSMSDNKSYMRNNSPGFTLNSIQENADMDSPLPEVRNGNGNGRQPGFGNISSAKIFTQQSSRFDMVATDDISDELPKMKAINHTHDPQQNREEELIHRQATEETVHNNAKSKSTPTQDQVTTLANYLQLLSQDHEKLKQQLNGVFNPNIANLLNGSEGIDHSLTNGGHVSTNTPSLSSGNQLHWDEQTHVSQNKFKYTYDVAFLVSQPLLHSIGSEVLSVEPLNCEDEEKAIQEAFSSSGRKVNYIRRFATVNNLRQLVSAETRIIHYCGHGIRKALIFENDLAQQIGMSHRLSANHLRALISAGQGGPTKISLVFVSACHSEDAGKAFVSAGVKHVVAVKRTAEMHDIAAGTFTKQFYFALVNGKTVKQAFEIANESIQAQFVENNYLKNESSKFILLPKKADHNVVLFEKAHADHIVGQHAKQFIEHTAKRGVKKFPQPPLGEWVGRFKSIHDLMHSILTDNLVVISCDKGLGKTAMLCRTLHYLWDRSLLNGIYYFNIYSVLKKHPSLSIAEIVSREMFPNKKSSHRNCSNKEFIQHLQEFISQKKTYLIVFEDIDEFEYEHLAEDQRIDIFIEELLSDIDNVKLLLTLGTPVNQCSFLAKLDKRVLKLKPLNNEQSIRLLETHLQKHFNLAKIRSNIPTEKIASFCKGYPLLIKYAANRFKNDDDLSNLNLRKQIREQVLTEFEALKMTRYWKELSLERNNLRLGELKKHIRQRDGQQLWEEMYGYRSRGLLNTLLYRMKEWYRKHVGDEQFKMRPIWTYYELEFIQMELLPFLAKGSKSRFKPPNEVVQNLLIGNNMSEDEMGANKKKKWYKFGKKKKDKKKVSANSSFIEDEDDNKVSEEEKIPIEVFAQFFEFWKDLWKTMMEPKVSPFYFKKDNEICLIAGMMKKERALSIISQFAKGTFLIRFSKQNAGSLVLVVSTGCDQKPSQHKIHINKSIEDGSVTFEYQTVRKGIHRSNSLYDLFNHLQFLEHLWYKRRGKEQEYIEKDKRKILKFFKSRADVWKL